MTFGYNVEFFVDSVARAKIKTLEARIAKLEKAVERLAQDPNA